MAGQHFWWQQVRATWQWCSGCSRRVPTCTPRPTYVTHPRGRSAVKPAGNTRKIDPKEASGTGWGSQGASLSIGVSFLSVILTVPLFVLHAFACLLACLLLCLLACFCLLCRMVGRHLWRQQVLANWPWCSGCSRRAPTWAPRAT